MNFKLKFIFQIIAAKIFIDNGFVIDNLHGVFGVFEICRVTAQLITIFIIVAIINSINFIDGIDSLALCIVVFFIILGRPPLSSQSRDGGHPEVQTSLEGGHPQLLPRREG